ncbi:MAG: threonine--tRNA ligase [Mycoplasmataceae bacterium]|nr:threonine--tRNA ligase [Mycoplasmataceae bacterium]
MHIDNELNALASILLAKAVKDLYPEAKLGESVLDNNGFNYSFAINKPISIKELPKILKQMYKNIDRNYVLSYETIDYKNAAKLFADEKFKLEAIKDQKNIHIIKFGNDFIDLCKKTKFSKLSAIKAIALNNVSGIYWKHNVKNQQLSSISGVAFEKQTDLGAFQKLISERKERDHRKLGSELELFTFDLMAGQGLPIWLPKGTAIKYEIDAYIHNLLQRYNYKFVSSPLLGSKALYETSGHWSHYRENMFPSLDVDGDIQVLRPMTCPHHLLVYQQKPRSYRELPYKVAEHAILHRYESSGSLTGLERVRSMQLIDTHVICTPKQIKSVVERCYQIINEASNTFGVKIHSVDLALHDKNNENKFFKNEKMWIDAEESLRKVLNELKINFKEEIGEAAFYGPKIDLQVQTALGRVITAYTIQLDFLLPERFKLEYKDEQGKIQRPVLIHASVIGTLERFLSILLEQNKGVFPLWLSPVQVAVIPVNPLKHGIYCEKITLALQQELIRVEFDNSDERLSKRIRDAQIQKIPYQLIIGDNEVKNDSVSYRRYGEQTSKEVSFNEFINILKQQIKKHQ